MSKNKTRRVCIALVTDSKENVLMGLRKDTNRWSNPGGHAEHGEDPYACVVREFFEETGLEAEDARLVKVEWNKKKNLLLYLFKVTPKPDQEIDTSGDPDKEFEDLHYVDPNDVVEELHVPAEDNMALKYWANS